MDYNKTDLTIVIDKSGSMGGSEGNVIEGVNAFIIEQQAFPGECVFSELQFDDKFEWRQQGVDLQHAQLLDRNSYRPRNRTRLRDAIGRAINQTEARSNRLPEDRKPGKKIIVIMTDGGENDSREFSHEALERLMRQKQEDGWEFIFLANGLEAERAGRSLNIKASNQRSFSKVGRGVQEAYQTTSAQVSQYRRTCKP